MSQFFRLSTVGALLIRVIDTGAAILGAAFGENTLAPAGITNVLYR